jgi:hypothetical protein
VVSRIKRRQGRRADQVGEHHSDLTALGAVFWTCAWGTRRGRCVNGGRLAARITVQSSNSIEKLQPMPDCRDAKLLQGLVRQARKDRLVYLILAESRLILPETQAPQPDHDVHKSAPNSGLRPIFVRSRESVQEARNGRG